MPPLLGLCLLATGCTPYLKSQLVTTYRYRSPLACTQGPLELRVQATGHRWGESFGLRVHSPRDIMGYYRIWVNGQIAKVGQFGMNKVVVRRVWKTRTRYEGRIQTDGSGKQWVFIREHTGRNQSRLVRVPYRYQVTYRTAAAVSRPGNQRCVRDGAPAALPRPTQTARGDAPVHAPRRPGPASAGDPVRGNRPVPGATRLPARRAAPRAPDRAGIPLVLLSTEHGRPRPELGRAATLRNETTVVWRFSRTTPREPGPCPAPALHPNGLRKGDEIRIQIWSDEPNDLEGAVFVLEHAIRVPSSSEKRYIAHLKRQHRQCLARRKAPARRPRRRPRRWCIVQLSHFLPSGVEVTFSRRVRCRCAHSAATAPCWGPGGRAGFSARVYRSFGSRDRCNVRLRATVQGRRYARGFWTRCRCLDRPADPACWGKEGFSSAYARRLARFTEEIRRRLRRERIRTERLARARLGPPPPPRKETRPPRPTARATWVPGYWLRSRTGWYWVRGWWRVPKAELGTPQTVRATVPPPAPKPLPRARPPRPVARAVWIPGAWYWDGRRFVWVPGSWRLPPSAHHRWRPPRWRRSGGRVLFLPGGWVLRAHP